MPLTEAMIRPGMVAYFDASVLNADPSVRSPRSPTTRSEPSVCFQVSGSTSAWAPITTTFRPERLAIRAEWRVDGGGDWISKDQYLNDGATAYVGANRVFTRASLAQDNCTDESRPCTADAGVAATPAEVRKHAGNCIA